jgi:hypothetical protein
MADEPDNLVLRLLREIRAAQDTQGETLKNMNGRIEDLYKISTHTLGVAANAHVRYEERSAPVQELARRVTQMETQR